MGTHYAPWQFDTCQNVGLCCAVCPWYTVAYGALRMSCIARHTHCIWLQCFDVLQSTIAALHSAGALHINKMQCVVLRDQCNAEGGRCDAVEVPRNATCVVRVRIAIWGRVASEDYNAMRVVDHPRVHCVVRIFNHTAMYHHLQELSNGFFAIVWRTTQCKRYWCAALSRAGALAPTKI
jgi:hypothetical protein